MQRKFRESDEDDSYFNTDDVDEENFPTKSSHINLDDNVSSVEDTENSNTNTAENMDRNETS